MFCVMAEAELVSEVMHAVEKCFVLTGWNETVIVLIPKVNDPYKVTQFLPINLCSVIFKVISKMMVTRLKRYSPRRYRRVSKCVCPRMSYYE